MRFFPLLSLPKIPLSIPDLSSLSLPLPKLAPSLSYGRVFKYGFVMYIQHTSAPNGMGGIGQRRRHHQERAADDVKAKLALYSGHVYEGHHHHQPDEDRPKLPYTDGRFCACLCNWIDGRACNACVCCVH